MDSESAPPSETVSLAPPPTASADDTHTSGQRYTRLHICIYLIFFLDCSAGFLLDVPLVQLLERTVCWHAAQAPGFVMPADPLDLCKSPAVQREVAIITGFKDTFDSIPGLLTALFYGSLADKIGRKPVLVMSFVGLYLHLLWILVVCYNKEMMPARVVWTASVFLMLGGGHKVFVSMIYTMMGDGSPAGISGRLFALSGIKMLSSTIAPLLSGLLMGFDLWTPFQLAVILNTISFPIILLAPETWVKPPRAELHDDQDRLAHQGAANQSASEPAAVPVATKPSHGYGKLLGSAAASILRPSRNCLGIFLHKQSLSVLFIVYFLHSFSVSNTLLLPQYAFDRLQWNWRQTTTLLSIKYGVTLLTIFVLFPLAVSSRLRRRPNITPKSCNLRIVQVCLCCSVIGYSCIASAREPIIFIAGLVSCAIGEGVEPAILSLVALLSHKDVKAKAYTAAGTLDILCIMLGRPTMAALYSVGLKGDKLLLGMPFAGSALLLFIAECLALAAV